VADLHILRDHALGFQEARKVAYKWVEQAQGEFGMACTYAESDAEDTVTFTRSGVNGTLQVTANCFVLEAKLGFLLGAFKDKIEAEIVKNLDTLLASNAKPKKAPRK